MKKLSLISLFLPLALVATSLAWAYGEGPGDSGRWVYGTVTYGDGSKCSVSPS